MTNTAVDKPDISKVALTECLLRNREQVYRVPLVPLDCTFGTVTIYDEKKTNIKDAIRKQNRKNGTDVTILFVVRNPGCQGCREHAQQLSKLAETDRKLMLLGAVKERGEANKALLEFYQDYFRQPIYHDEKWSLFKAMGRKKLGVLELIQTKFRARTRLAGKSIQTGPGGDSFTQGGMLVFNKKGELCFALEDNPFEALDMELLAAAVKEARKQ